MVNRVHKTLGLREKPLYCVESGKTDVTMVKVEHKRCQKEFIHALVSTKIGIYSWKWECIKHCSELLAVVMAMLRNGVRSQLTVMLVDDIVICNHTTTRHMYVIIQWLTNG